MEKNTEFKNAGYDKNAGFNKINGDVKNIEVVQEIEQSQSIANDDLLALQGGLTASVTGASAITKDNQPNPPFKVPSSHALRGDYSTMAPDYTVAQKYGVYTEDEQERWRFLYARQSALLPGYADQEFLDGLKILGSSNSIPDLDEVNERLYAATKWKLVAVPGLIPNDVFFNHLVNCRFPVSWWMRDAGEMDYLVEPDIFHDFFGHVPLLSNQIFADYMQLIGEQGVKAVALDADDIMARLYWYIIEFGLINTPDGLRAFGAGMLSSKSETIYSVDSPEPIRLEFDLERVMSTDYRVDSFQKTYFVIDSYQSLFEAISRDLTGIFSRIKEREIIDPKSRKTGDRVINAGLW